MGNALHTNNDEQAAALALSLDNPEKLKAYQSALLEKWSGKGPQRGSDWLNEASVDAGFPKLENDNQRLTMAMLLENQYRYQKAHEFRVGADGVVLMQDTTTADEALPTKYALPIIRRAYVPLIKNDWSVVQPLAGPTGFIFWLDFIRENDSTNILSVEYNQALTPELGVPKKSKLALNRVSITVVKQLLGCTWSSEAMEDARAQLGIDVEQELMNAFTMEFVRDLFGRHLLNIYNAASTGTATGQALVAPWAGPNPAHNIPARGGATLAEYKTTVYNSLVDTNTDFMRANRVPADGIVAGYGLAAFLNKMITATSVTNPTDSNTTELGFTNYGTFAGRWTIWGTEFLPDNAGFMYKRNPNPLYAGHVYAPYIPIQVMPAIYADFDPVTGNYQNKDAYTRNIRERSVDYVTKPYAFQPITGTAGNVF